MSVGTKRKTKMYRSQKLQYVGLAVLAAAAFGVVGFVFLGPTPGAPSSSVTFTPKPVVSPTPTPTPAPVLAEGMLGAIQAAVQTGGAEPLVISVLGDSTGNGPGEWVDLWAQHLAKYGTVTLHQWEQVANDWDPAPKAYPGAGGRSIEIWNGSQPGSTYTYPLERLELIQPVKPSFVILSFGHNLAPKTADLGSVDLLAAVDAKWGTAIPAVVTIQNPAQGSRETRTQTSVDVLTAWAPRAGYPTINVNKAFIDNGGAAALLQDEVHPNGAGSKVWADAVIATLG